MCLYSYECVRVCLRVNEPPLGLNSSLSHQSAHQGSAGDGGQALPAIWSCKRFQGAVCICVCLRVCARACVRFGVGCVGGVTPDLFTHQLASDRPPESSSSRQ